MWCGSAKCCRVPRSTPHLQAANTCDVFFSIGTSGVVEPAASLARVAMQHGATVIEINPAITPLTSRLRLRCKAHQVKFCLR